MAVCYSCGNPLDPRARIYRNTVCEKCGKELHVCLNCKFYAPGAHWDCRETISDPVHEKDRANFCDFFALAEGNGNAESGNRGGNDGKKAEDARSQFDSLFGNE